MPTFELTRCRLRPWRQGDQPALVRYANDRAVWRNLRDRFPHPYTAEDADDWITYAAGQADTTLAIEVGGEVVGGIGIEPGHDVYRRSAELGYWLGQPHWGNGIASEIVPVVTDYALSRFDFDRLQATVFSWNPASMRVLEKSGYEREAVLKRAVFKDGAVLDLVIFARLC